MEINLKISYDKSSNGGISEFALLCEMLEVYRKNRVSCLKAISSEIKVAGATVTPDMIDDLQKFINEWDTFESLMNKIDSEVFPEG
jgi:hypothetical protein